MTSCFRFKAVAKLLIKSGADVNIRDKNSCTAFDMASVMGGLKKKEINNNYFSGRKSIVSLKWIWILEIWRDSLFALLQLNNSSCLLLRKKEKNWHNQLN